MRRILAVATLVVFSAISAKAATITGSLFDFNAANTTVGSVHTIGVYIKTDVPNGVSAVEMDITSTASGKANFGTQPGATKANSSASAISATDGYTLVKPNLSTDGSGDTSLWNPKPVVGASTDGDFDVVGFSLISTPGDVNSNPGDGGALGQKQTGLGDLAGTTVWVFSATEQLNLYLSSAQYYTDTTGGSTTANADFTPQSVTGASITVTIVPEPASLVLLGLGGLGLAYAARRRAA